MKDTTDLPQETNDSRPAQRMSSEGIRAMQGPEPPEKAEWIDRGIQDVPLNRIDLRGEHLYDAQDPRGDSYAQIADGVHKLQDTVRPAVGAGQQRDYFQGLDREQGLDPATNGYTKVYDSFYGSDPVTVAKDGNHYEVDKGRHRLYVAQAEGLDSLPARVKERQPPSTGQPT